MIIDVCKNVLMNRVDFRGIEENGVFKQRL